MSCTQGTNRDLFLSELERLSTELMGKNLTKITIQHSDYNKVTKWLGENASIQTFDNMEFDYEKGTVTLNVPIDDVVYQQYLKKFEPQRFEGQREANQFAMGFKGKIKPPPGWND